VCKGSSTTTTQEGENIALTGRLVERRKKEKREGLSQKELFCSESIESRKDTFVL